MLIFAGVFGDPSRERRVERVRHHQKEDQVETRLGLEETIAGRGPWGRVRIARSSGSGSDASPVPAALTFDDGPDPLWTPRILDALRRAEARATFFVIASLALRYPHIVCDVLEAGHAVEFHCVEHVRHTHRSRREVEADTREGLGVLRSLGVVPRLWRPPWGILAPWTEEVADRFGLRLALWNIDTHDWRGDAAPEMLRRAEPFLGPDSVLLMHDGIGPGSRRTGCEETVALVEDLVARLRSIGCEPGLLTPAERRGVGA